MAPASRTPGLLAPLFIAGVCVLWGLLPELAVFSDENAIIRKVINFVLE